MNSISSADPIKDNNSVVLSFANNRLANAVFGQLGENLAQIQKYLPVYINTIGSEIKIEGDPESLQNARRIFDHLYDMALEGQNPSPTDIDTAIKMLSLDPLSEDHSTAKIITNLSNENEIAKIETNEKNIIAKTPNQNIYLRALGNSELVFSIGPAGTGKTYLAVAHAVMLLERGIIERIILSRPAVEAGERLGFLPGDIREKVDPYLRPLYDALYDFVPATKIEKAISNGTIEIAPLAFMRGRTLSHSAIILDEAQNTTFMQMKMFLTRIGECSRMTVTGDPSQIDLPSGEVSGLIKALQILKTIPEIAMIEFNENDVMRHALVTKIIGAYEKEMEKGRRVRQEKTER